jgi:hypothetical protein
MHREYEDFRFRRHFADLTGGVDSVQSGERYVEHNHIGIVLDRHIDGLSPVASLAANDESTFRLEQGADAAPDHLMVVR